MSLLTEGQRTVWELPKSYARIFVRKENEINMACRLHVVYEHASQFYSKKIERDYLEDLGIDGSRILKCICCSECMKRIFLAQDKD
jgi:hypothetical protein